MKLPRPSATGVALLGVLVLGILARLAALLANRSLWLDEAMLALNIGRHSFARLAGPLDYDQSAPLLFLWGAKAITLVAGMGEVALRSIPFLTGILIPVLVWRVVKSLAGRDAALIASALAALSVPLLRYSAEFKHYGIEAFVTIGLIALTAGLRVAPDRPARWWQLFGAGAVGMLLSFAAPFVMAGGFAALLLDPCFRQDALFRRRVGLLALGWGVAFALVFVAVYQPQAGSRFMQEYWAETFLDPHAPNFGRRMFAVAATWSRSLPPLPEAVQMRWQLAMLGLGIVLVARRGGLSAAAVIVVPFLAYLVGAVVARYPVGDRLLLFAVPLTCAAVSVLIAEGLRLLRLGETNRALVGLLLVLGWAGPNAWTRWRHPVISWDGRTSARLIASSAQSEPVYLIPGSIPVWAYYTTDWADPDTTRLAYFARASRGAGPAAMNGVIPEDPASSKQDSLWYRSRGRVDLLGRRSGLIYLEQQEFVQSIPDSGWAASEVDRIVAWARPGAWLYGEEWSEMQIDVLEREVRRRGIEWSSRLRLKNSAAVRVQVPGDSSLSRAAPR